MPKQSSDQFENENTDELPILLETVALDDDIELLVPPHHEDTAKHAALHAVAADHMASAELTEREPEPPRGTVAASAAAPVLAESALPETQQLREDYAALAAYIANRRTWWDEMQAANTRLAARVAALEHELGATAKRLATSEAFAARESGRAVALRAELVDYARRADALEREQRLAHGAAAAPPAPLAAADTAATEAPAAVVAAAQPASASGLSPAAASPPVLTDAVDAAAPAMETIGQLEAEVEYKRQQVAAQLVELREREQRLRALTNELEHARRELGTLRTELADSRSNAARLERAVVDKDRALDARDTRIATLHEELRQRNVVAEKRSVKESLQIDSDKRASARDGAADHKPAAALICLTGDAPKHFALTKKSVTIGRGPQCDLQIVTHFVSREHARLTLNGGAAVIEDLGSRNGVFVNSIRVDRHHLQQGDLLTIGETQFRFVESMAH